ncbi:MAG: DNA polymerase III subunit delta [Pseudomonadota bacterium]
MKLSARDAARFANAPDLSLAGVLIYGEDGLEVAERRKRVAAAVIGDGQEADMRLHRVTAAEARKGPAAIMDAMRARGFFGGRAVVVIDDAADGVSASVAAALAEAAPEDGFLIVCAGMLPARSKLRKVFEGARNAAAAPCYQDAIDRQAAQAMLQEAGVRAVADDAMNDIEAIARDADKAMFRDFAERLALYMLSAGQPASRDDVAATAPGAGDADLDAALDSVADGRASDIGPAMARLAAQGRGATTVAIAAQRYFRRMHTVLSHAEGDGLEAAAGRLRPPVFGARRDGLIRRCRIWGLSSTEGALRLLTDVDNALRGGAEGPANATLERALLKLALTARSSRR